MNEPESFSWSPGQTIRRRDLHAKIGGQRQGGISTLRTGGAILLITGDSGKRYGYSDEWTDDGVFLYLGEGQRGDMKFRGGNRAIRDHAQDRRTLQLFEQNKKDKRFLRVSLGQPTKVPIGRAVAVRPTFSQDLAAFSTTQVKGEA